MINQTTLKEEFNIRYSMAGYEFDLRENIWNLKRNVIINLSFLDGYLEKNFHEGFIHTLAYFAQIYKPESVSSFIVKIKAIMFGYNVRTFSEHELITAYSDLQRKDYEKFIMFKRFIIKWKELGYFGIDDNAYEYLKVITIPTSIHGDVVKRRDPKLGPFNDLEIKMIVDGLETGIKQGIVSEHCYIFTRILLLSGRRPIQIMSLKHRDVVKNERGYFLRIPRAKQKNNVFRGAFREIEITEDIWEYLMKVMIHNINKVKEIISEDLNEKFFDDLPIFLSITQLRKVADEIDFSEYLHCDFLHINTGQARFWLKDFAKKFKMYSPRTGELLKIHPVRFRYTFGTLLARSGENLSTIAFAMDHSSDTSAGYYIKNLSDNVNVINKAVERYLTDLSDVFLGKRGYQGDLLQKALTMDIKKENKNNRNCDGCQHFKAWNRRGNDSLNI